MESERLHYAFGRFRLDPDRRILWRDGQPVAIPPKPLRLLIVLIEHRGKLLTKDQLIEMVWSDTIGTEANLSVNIASLRRILGEKPRDHRYIVTVPQRGYSFVADVRLTDHDGGISPPKPPAPETIPRIRQVAVLPFRAAGLPSGSEYVGLGLSEIISTELAQLREFSVRPASSTRSYANTTLAGAAAGRALGVDAVLEGTLLQSGQTFAVTAQLICVEDEVVLWADSFSLPVSELTEVAARITRGVIKRLEAATALAEPGNLTENPAAFRAYLHGRYCQLALERDSFEKSVAFFEEAIALDPSFALAHAALARAYYHMWWLGMYPSRQGAERVEAAASRALELAPSLTDAIVCLGFVDLGGRYRFEDARSRFEQALAMSPLSTIAHRGYAQYMIATGQLDEALRRTRLALSLDPTSLENNVLFGFTLMMRREYRKAVEHFQAISALEPRFTWATFLLGWSHALDGDLASARDIFQRMNAKATPPWVHAMLACIHLRMDDKEAAKAHLADFSTAASRQRLSLFWCAVVNIARDRIDAAMDCLEKARDQGEPFIALIGVDPRWDALRHLPRFQELVLQVRGGHADLL